MAKFTLTVRGNGDFPVDMLRYDECWPSTTADAVKLGDTTRRTVELLSDRNPTRDRWDSFCWTLVGVRLN